MGEYARRIGQAQVGESAGALAREDALAALCDVLMNVHAAAGDLVHGLGHEGDLEAQLVGRGLQDPLGEHNGVRGAREAHEIQLYLHLGRADLVMVVLHGDARVQHGPDGPIP